MGNNNIFREIIWRLSHFSPLAWGLILLFIAFILIQFDSSFVKKLAILPTVIALFLLYQAIFKGKIY